MSPHALECISQNVCMYATKKDVIDISYNACLVCGPKSLSLQTVYHYSDMTLSQSFQIMAAQLSTTAVPKLAESLATASCRSCNARPGWCPHRHFRNGLKRPLGMTFPEDCVDLVVSFQWRHFGLSTTTWFQWLYGIIIEVLVTTDIVTPIWQ